MAGFEINYPKTLQLNLPFLPQCQIFMIVLFISPPDQKVKFYVFSPSGQGMQPILATNWIPKLKKDTKTEKKNGMNHKWYTYEKGWLLFTLLPGTTNREETTKLIIGIEYADHLVL